jgi:large subunit ribosomal protein L25
MDIANIRGEARSATGRNANARLRERGMIPAVVYGHGAANESLSLSEHDLRLALEHNMHLVAVDVSGSPTNYLIKEVQYDYLDRYPIHVDLMRVNLDERVEVNVPVRLKGEAPGVAEGGDLLHNLTELKVECKVSEIPDFFSVNITSLGIDESISVSEVAVPAGVKVLDDPEEAIVAVRPKRAAELEVVEEAEAAPEGESAEPEVIGRGKEEGEEEGG